MKTHPSPPHHPTGQITDLVAYPHTIYQNHLSHDDLDALLTQGDNH